MTTLTRASKFAVSKNYELQSHKHNVSYFKGFALTAYHTLVWWRHPEQVWKGCSQIGDRFAIRRLKESDKVHPQGYPLTRGWLQK